MNRPAAGLTFSWPPRRGTAALLTVALVFAAWVFSPAWSGQLGQDARVFYAAGLLRAHGGNPYDPVQQFREEDTLFNRDGAVRAGDPGFFSHATYANPPAFTAVLTAGARLLPRSSFVVVVVAAVAAFGIVGLEILLTLVGWQGRWWARGFFLTASPMLIGTFVGNTSTILLAASAAGLLLMARRRPFLGGAVLAACWLKPSVGLLVAAAILAAGPGSRRRSFFGFLAGSCGFFGLDLLAAGPGGLASWARALAGYGGALGQVASNGGEFARNGQALTGIPAFFMDRLPVSLSIALGAVFIALVVGLALRGRRALRPGDLRTVALAIAAVVAISPYLHLNDLVLDLLPVLLIAARPLTRVSRTVLVLLALSAPAGLVYGLALAAAPAGHGPSALGFGALLNLGILVAVARSIRGDPVILHAMEGGGGEAR